MCLQYLTVALFIFIVNLFPDGHFDISALDRLENGAGITIFNKLAPKLLEMATALHFDESILDTLSQENNPVERTKDMMKAWLSGESSLPSTWQVLLETLQAIDMKEVPQEIEHFFNRTSVTSPSASLVSHACASGGVVLLTLTLTE